MSQERAKQPEYATELKLLAVRRVLAGENVSAVAQELGLRRKRLYVWKDRRSAVSSADDSPSARYPIHSVTVHRFCHDSRSSRISVEPKPQWVAALDHLHCEAVSTMPARTGFNST